MTRRHRLKSMQARLLALLLGLVIVIWTGSAIMTWVDARDELDDLLDGHLAQAAALLVVQQARSDDDDGVADAPVLHKYAPLVAFQVFHEDRLVMRSANASTTPMTSKDHGFTTVRLNDGEKWRVFVTHGQERDVMVYVGEQTASRNAILWAILNSMLLPLLLALPLLAAGGWWAVRRGLAPLRQLSKLLQQRQPHGLEPIELHDMPLEMKPVADSLNGLFERIDHMVTSERRFTADAAHELRTPIAGIRAQAQVAMGAVDDIEQRNHALQATLAGCDRASRLVEQLLTLARLEAAPASSAAPAPTIDLSAVVRRIAADLATTALANHQTLELDALAPCMVVGNDMLVGVLVRNLIDNAIRYSPAGARILVSVTSEAGKPLLRVEDSGPGLLDADMPRLGERFFRVLGNEQPGSGLGWSIVKRIADVFGAQLNVSRSEQLGGLAVAVHWRVLPA